MQSRKSQAHTVTENLLRTQGPDGGFHTGYDQAGTYAGTQENGETTIVMIAISNLSITSPFPFPFFPRPSWIIYLYIGLGVVAVGVVITVLVLEQRKRKPVFRTTDDLSLLFLVERVQLTYFDMFVFSTGHSCEETGFR